MAIITIPAMTPPTMGPVLLLLEGDAVDEDGEVVDFGADVVEAGNSVADEACVVVTVWEGEEELGAPINAPGPISGLSEEGRCENDREKRWRRVPTAGGHRFIRIPSILLLTYIVSLCRDT